MAEHFDAVIVGSGFGGAIPALRIADKGKQVLVLERGYRFTEKDFRQEWSIKNLMRFFNVVPSDDYTLIFRTANLMGGGSVLYSGASLRAPTEVFQFVDKDGYKVWPNGVTRQVLDPYYDRVETMMEINRPGWDEVPKSGGTFAKMLNNMGLTCDRAKFPYVNCRQCGFCEAGCIYGTKRHLGFNYIPTAEKYGAVFREGCKAREVYPSSNGYTVKYIDRFRNEKEVEGEVVVLAGGAAGTPEILLRSKKNGLPALSDQVGKNFNNNGDLAFFFALPDTGFEPYKVYAGRTNAVMITYAFWYEHKITIHTGSQPPGVFAVLDFKREGMPPWGLEYKHFLKEHYPSGIIGALAIELITGEGEVNLSNDLPVAKLPMTDELLNYHRRVLNIAKMIADANNAELLAIPENIPYGDAHLLGTCRMGEDPQRSVLDSNCEVRGYPGLFVSDSSSIPGGTGVNPSFTIAANAERIGDYIAGIL